MLTVTIKLSMTMIFIIRLYDLIVRSANKTINLEKLPGRFGCLVTALHTLCSDYSGSYCVL